MNENYFIQVRTHLRDRHIKLWESPYYVEGQGAVDDKIDELAKECSRALNIDESNCKIVLLNLQERALKNIVARQEYDTTGIARFSVRRLANDVGSLVNIDVKCSLESMGYELMGIIAKEFGLSSYHQVKCIAGGKIIDPNKTLSAQCLKNNQQLLVIVSQIDQKHSDAKEAMHDRIRKIKMDIEAIVDSKQQLFEMEDQDGKPVFLPPAENRAILIAMGFCEKARAAMKREEYDETLILLLEADEKFATCNSKFLESIDNYALVNLDIVWCYLCLKNVNELPDAERRLKLCEDSFRRSYGEEMCRLVAIKGSACAERALLMRLHLMQGVLLFHRNRRFEAEQKFAQASSELQELKIKEESVMLLMEMGYEPLEARLGLRSAGGNVERAVNFIHERREKLRSTREHSEAERKISKNLSLNPDVDWVNPRSVHTLMEMGYDQDVVVEALRLSKNDLKQALDLLTTKQDELRQNLPPPVNADSTLLESLLRLGFDENMARMCLELANNNVDDAVQYLVSMHEESPELMNNLQQFVANAIRASTSASATNVTQDGPSTSQGGASTTKLLMQKIARKARSQLKSMEAYNRFNEDITGQDDEHLDLPLIQEENILAEYKALLEH